MRLSIALFAAVFASACTATDAPAPTASAASAMQAAFTTVPEPAPTPLPPLSPPARRQREIEAMSGAELARWILPDEAASIAAAELYPARWGILMYGLLWRAPRPAQFPGVCEIGGYGVSFRIENENSLSQQERLDPPLQPYQILEQRRYRVAGSTEAGAAALDCTGGQPYWDWSTAPSAKAIYRAANLMERAQLRDRRSRGNPGFRLACSQFQVDERTGASSNVRCGNASDLLQRLRPELIQRMQKTACQGDISAVSEGPCIAVQYDDPAAPGTHSFYTVRIDAGDKDARSIEIIQGMMPPH